eukprot:snap_masked-scaffold_8-processed-gene-10.26-mRNA-1 protein AED:1.00 eAED:1.00 QI:0/0/0/0/1/1/2/0/128
MKKQHFVRIRRETKPFILQANNIASNNFQSANKNNQQSARKCSKKIPSYQAGFSKHGAAINKIEILKRIITKSATENLELKMLCIDFKKAFDSVSDCFIYLSPKAHGVSKSLTKKDHVALEFSKSQNS